MYIFFGAVVLWCIVTVAANYRHDMRLWRMRHHIANDTDYWEER